MTSVASDLNLFIVLALICCAIFGLRSFLYGVPAFFALAIHAYLIHVWVGLLEVDFGDLAFIRPPTAILWNSIYLVLLTAIAALAVAKEAVRQRNRAGIVA